MAEIIIEPFGRLDVGGMSDAELETNHKALRALDRSNIVPKEWQTQLFINSRNVADEIKRRGL